LHEPSISAQSELMVHEAIDILSVDCISRVEGERELIVASSEGDTLHREVFDFIKGYNRLDLEIHLPVGRYTLSFSESTSTSALGTVSPQLYYNERPDEGGWALAHLATLNAESESSPYNYFYNWKVKPHYDSCMSDLIPFKIELDTTVSTNQLLADSDWDVYPNPAVNEVRLRCSSCKDTHYTVRTANGNVMVSGEMDGQQAEIELTSWPSGVYLITLVDNNRKSTKRIAVAR